jgi:hypothetical protein
VLKPEDDAVLARRRDETGFFTGGGMLTLSGFDAAARVIAATGRGVSSFLSLGREGSGAMFADDFAVSGVDAAGIAALAGFCKGVGAMADGSEKVRLWPGEETEIEIVVPVLERKI